MVSSAECYEIYCKNLKMLDLRKRVQQRRNNIIKTRCMHNAMYVLQRLGILLFLLNPLTATNVL
jgi:hypothetical protein